MSADSKLIGQVAAVVPGHTIHAAVRVNLLSDDPATAAGFPAVGQQAFGLSDDHLVVCSRSSLSGRPKKFLLALPLADFAAVDFEPGKLQDRLTFTMRSGAQVEFSCVKVDPGAAFATALTAALKA